MTIRIYNPVKANSSYAPVFSNVKQVTQFKIILHDGTEMDKKLSAKVEILSIADVPDDYYEAKEFWNGLGVDLARLNIKMRTHEFDSLDLPKFI